MRRWMIVFALYAVMFDAFRYVSAEIRDNSGRAPAPYRIVNAERTVIQEKSDGSIYCFYENATEADWERIKKLLEYSGYIPGETSIKDLNRMFCSYNVESSALIMVAFSPESGNMMMIISKSEGLLNDEELDQLADYYERVIGLPEESKGCFVYLYD